MVGPGMQRLLQSLTLESTTDQYKEKLNRTRRWFTPSSQDPRRAWVAFDPFKSPKERVLSFGGPRNGGWLEILILINSILGGALASALVPATSWLGESAAFVVGGIIFWLALVARARRVMNRVDSD
jgi:hypothetical protein